MNQIFSHRRAQLQSALPNKSILLSNGFARTGHIPSCSPQFRGDSSFQFYFGKSPKGAMALFSEGKVKFFVPKRDPESVVWSGRIASLSELEESFGVESAHYLEELPELVEFEKAELLFTLPGCPKASEYLVSLTGRYYDPENLDKPLVSQIISQRRVQDDFAKTELRQAAIASLDVHLALYSELASGRLKNKSLYHALAILESETRKRGSRNSFAPIVTTDGEVLHNCSYDGLVSPGRLLLVDFGLELPSGYGGDITRVWPVCGRFSPEQAAIYQLVLEMQRSALEELRPGQWFAEAHRASMRTLVSGLIDLGILDGSVEDLLEKRVGELFFPHGLGHLLGLDVHDLELFGKQALNASKEPETSKLRFNQPVEEGMCLTVEPGIYFIPALLEKEGEANRFINREVLAQFINIGGIRIEDDILIGSEHQYNENLTQGLFKEIKEIEF